MTEAERSRNEKENSAELENLFHSREVKEKRELRISV